MSRRRLLVLVSAVGVLALVGCSPSPAPEPTATVTETATPSPSPTPTASASVDPNAPANQCPNDSLEVAVVESDAGAGNLFYQVTFTNTGSAPCDLRGFPGVSVVGDGNGTQLGAAAAEATGGPEVETYTIAPDDSVGAALQAVNIASGGGPLGDACDVVTGDGWRIYPPHSFDAVFVESAGLPACANVATPWLTVGPVSSQ
ncbi:DUF4232 domain-containing protein [Herbiconiux sp. L3-i23]|uniref:DUF4232 domain-containing protein n=1 Tax=Herbiconiux sp. L3-i23 TaxID=2905871 RepID=UPI0020709B5B|nr:DUF4232 domain-containing protein [Herbiconiux sp. L3-i23]BDI21579.1 hypothetical protein L3i23_03550 [Herbiconiux sp. L3-i23]